MSFVEQSRAEARALMPQFMPEPVVDATLDILGTPKAAEQRASPDIERILGRPSRTFAEWAARNTTAFKTGWRRTRHRCRPWPSWPRPHLAT
jgi:hypothetical protein